MKKGLIICCLFCAVLSAQNNRIDSLSSLLNTITEDTNQVIIYNKLGFELIWVGDFDRALPHIVNGLDLSKKLDYQKGIAQSYNGLGIIYRNKGEHKKALQHFFFSLEVATEIESKPMMGSLYSNIGRVYANLGDYPKALEYFYKSLRIMQMIGDKSKTANVLRGIGKIYLLQKDVKARYCFFESLKLYKEINIYEGIAGSLNDIGDYYAQSGNQTKSLSYYYQSLEVSKKAEYLTERANSYNHLGLIYADQKQYSKASENYLTALESYIQLNNSEEQSSVYYNLGELEFYHNNYQKALEYYQFSLNKAIMSGVLAKQKDAHEGLSKTYEILGKSADALVHYKSFIKVREQIFNDDNTRKLVRAELNFEFEMKEKQMIFEKTQTESKVKQVRIQSYFLIVSLAFVLLLGLFLLQRLSLKQKLKVSKLRNKIAIDLHDEVGSSLSSISMYAGITQVNNDPKIQAEIINKIGNTSRETIENMSDIVWSIQPKNDNFQLVLNRMEHFGNQIMAAAGIDFSFNYNENIRSLSLNMEQRKNLYLIYKEALNNAAKYSKATNVVVSINKNKKNLTLLIKDNGVGFDPEGIKTGNGLNNMKERAMVIAGLFKIQSSAGTGTTIQLQFKTG